MDQAAPGRGRKAELASEATVPPNPERRLPELRLAAAEKWEHAFARLRARLKWARRIDAENRRLMSEAAGRPFLDFMALRRPRRPNNYLVANRQITLAPADARPPRLPVPPRALAAMWLAVVEEEPRSRITAVSQAGLHIEASCKSRRFGFVDDISAAIFSDGKGGSTIAVYSRARQGYWDLGVNRRRVKRWLRKVVEWSREEI